MAQNQDFDWSPNIPFKIYEKDYAGFIHRLVKVLGKNSETNFIERGVNKREYVKIMLETHQDDRALDAHMRRDNLYVTAISRRGSDTIFKCKGVEDFGEGSRDLSFGESYQSMTRHLEDREIYTLNYCEFVQAVETLINEMGTKDLDNLDTHKWARRIFTILSVVAEGARNKVVSVSYNDSIIHNAPTTTHWMWIKLMFNSWESFSNAAIGYDDIKLSDLTKEERDMLFAKNVPPTAKDLEKNLEKVLARSDICRAALYVLCGHLKPLQAGNNSLWHILNPKRYTHAKIPI
ncbi:aconitate hydratase, cytoplasmic [Tanacetum coccineum]